MRIFYLAFIFFLAFESKVTAQPGVLDPTFGHNTYIATHFSTDDRDAAYSVSVQQDGKIVAAGYSKNGNDKSLSLTRYDSYGVLDSSFGSGGKVTRALSGHEEALSVAIQSDGKIVTAGDGQSAGISSDFVLSRFNSDGTNDSSFNSDGILTTNFGSGDDKAYAILLQPDNKIVAVGYSDVGATNDFAIARYNSDGSLDNTFSSDGKQLIGFNNDDEAYCAVLQSDGKIIAAGTSDNGNDLDIAVTRLMPNGSLDSSFGMNGKILTDLSGKDDIAYSIALQTDGKILVAGQHRKSINAEFFLMRYTTDGIVDSTFGSNGILIYDFTSEAEIIRSMQMQPDGKIVVAGYCGSGSNKNFIVVRLNVDGTLDTSFDQDGIVIYDFLGEEDLGYSIALQSDGKIIEAGSCVLKTKVYFGLIRLNTDGSTDVIPKNGEMSISFSPGVGAILNKILIQPDNKIITIGYSGIYGYNQSDFAIARFSPDGSLDTSFGIEGKVLYSFSGNINRPFAGVLQPDGKIIVGGGGSSFPDFFLIARLNTDGTLDNSFGTFGYVITSFGGDAGISDISLQSDGKIVAGGYSSNSPNGYASMTIVRYNSDGSIDNSFGNTGKTILDFSPELRSLKIQPDGKIIVAGESFMNFSYLWNFGIARLLPNGTLDFGFGNDGIVSTNIVDQDYNEWVSDISILPDGKFICSGNTELNGSISEIAVVRYNSNGSIDSSFATNGKIISGLPDSYLITNSLIVSPDGKIIVIGFGRSLSLSYNHFMLIRYNEDGSLDQTFGTNGWVFTDFGGDDDAAYSAALQSDAKIVVGGTAGNYDEEEFGLARYLNDIALINTSIPNQTTSVNIFPNPTSGIINIHSENISELNTEIIVYSITGKKLLQQDLNRNKNFDEQINLTGYPAGTYLVSVKTKSSVFVQKVQLVK